jgi:fumarate hydratase subunit beta
MKRIRTPLTQKDCFGLHAGQEVLLSGVIYTARDQAHKRLVDAIHARKRLPFDLRGQVVYFCGPTETPPGAVIGSCGPTTSRRMDAFSPFLLAQGLVGMIGKGDRSDDVVSAIRKCQGVYFLAYAGCGAMAAQFVTESTVVAYPELGPEAVRRLVVADMPLIVGIDCKGNNVFRSNRV